MQRPNNMQRKGTTEIILVNKIPLTNSKIQPPQNKFQKNNKLLYNVIKTIDLLIEEDSFAHRNKPHTINQN